MHYIDGRFSRRTTTPGKCFHWMLTSFTGVSATGVLPLLLGSHSNIRPCKTLLPLLTDPRWTRERNNFSQPPLSYPPRVHRRCGNKRNSCLKSILLPSDHCSTPNSRFVCTVLPPHPCVGVTFSSLRGVLECSDRNLGLSLNRWGLTSGGKSQDGREVTGLVPRPELAVGGKGPVSENWFFRVTDKSVVIVITEIGGAVTGVRRDSLIRSHCTVPFSRPSSGSFPVFLGFFLRFCEDRYPVRRRFGGGDDNPLRRKIFPLIHSQTIV